MLHALIIKNLEGNRGDHQQQKRCRTRLQQQGKAVLAVFPGKLLFSEVDTLAVPGVTAGQGQGLIEGTLGPAFGQVFQDLNIYKAQPVPGVMLALQFLAKDCPAFGKCSNRPANAQLCKLVFSPRWS